jgi:16S rRNA (adenine1518-N6/adenine1519-N6)-dimethyltransferase
MLQLEAADRILATHGTKAFGPLAILAQAAYTCTARHTVAAACFHPRPDVTSALVHLQRRADAVVLAPPAAAFLREAFQQRRKQLGARVRALAAASGIDPAGLEALGLRGELRAEQVPVPVWLSLARIWPAAT